MDVITPAHGLTALKPVPPIDINDINVLPADLQAELIRLRGEFAVDREKLKEISARFEQELQDGLDQYGSNISMNVTWVLGWPDGHETGEFLTLDLGGTNLRVCWIELKGDQGDIVVTQDQYKLSDEIKVGGAEPLWDFCAECLEEFINKHNLKGTEDEPLQLGFTFSYPAHQDYIDHGKLVTWTKGFQIDGVEGNDAAGQLIEAIEKKKLPIHLVCLINDTTGAMIASAYNDHETIAGAIFGTGCNAAYMDNVGSIGKLSTDLPNDTPMAINCEYGAFDNARNVLPLTSYDRQIDAESPKPGEQAFEKMSAGLYLGEIFRLVTLELHERGSLFENQDVSKLREPYLLDTAFLSLVENDMSSGMPHTRTAYKDMLGIDITPDERVFCNRVAELIAVRASRLCTCGIAAICHKKGITSGHVAADGSVANKHPHFKERWAIALGEQLDWPADREKDPITITSAEDGSGVGAAVIAAMTIKRFKEGNTAGIKAG